MNGEANSHAASGHSYKHSTIVNYYDRCRIDCKIDYSKTLESLFTLT